MAHDVSRVAEAGLAPARSPRPPATPSPGCAPPPTRRSPASRSPRNARAARRLGVPATVAIRPRSSGSPNRGPKASGPVGEVRGDGRSAERRRPRRLDERSPTATPVVTRAVAAGSHAAAVVPARRGRTPANWWTAQDRARRPGPSRWATALPEVVLRVVGVATARHRHSRHRYRARRRCTRPDRGGRRDRSPLRTTTTSCRALQPPPR